MRITAAAKLEVRQRIIDTALDLFASHGYSQTTTRDIATAVGIAVGTFFNHFPTKESLALVILDQALGDGEKAFLKRRRGDEDLTEDLFAHVLEGLHKLKRHRRYAGEVLEKATSPFTNSEMSAGRQIRAAHLKMVTQVLTWHGFSPTVSVFLSHLYWTLYLGVVAFWVNDSSKQQQDTLVVLDQSIRLFVSVLRKEAARQTSKPSWPFCSSFQ